MAFHFPRVEPPPNVELENWLSWSWQSQNALKTLQDYQDFFDLSDEEQRGFNGLDKIFRARTTQYYASLASKTEPNDPIRKILMPHRLELTDGAQQMLDPLGERKNNPAPRVIHRYTDRALFLVTDFCSVYCRYCTRKHFTATDQVFPNKSEYEQAIEYFRKTPQIKEVILSGGDPLTLSDEKLERILFDLRSIEHIELIRIGSRIPVVAPMRITSELAKLFRQAKPVYMMTHFNHPKELTAESAEAVEMFVDHGTPVFNQMVLLNGVNNHANIVKALSRRLLYLRVKPYYMFQCDPSEGTDHLRTSIEDSLEIQKQLWGNISGLAMPNLSLDIPNGGGKVGLVPDFTVSKSEHSHKFKGWDGVKSEYINPPKEKIVKPIDANEWC